MLRKFSQAFKFKDIMYYSVETLTVQTIIQLTNE